MHKAHGIWRCADGCAGAPQDDDDHHHRRVDLLGTAIAVLRDFDVNAIDAMGAFDGLDKPIVEAVDLTFVADKVTDGYLEDIFRGLGGSGRLKAIRLKNCLKLTDATVDNLVKLCRNGPEYVDIRGCTRISVEAISRLKAQVSALKSLDTDSHTKRITHALALRALGDRDAAHTIQENISRDVASTARSAAKRVGNMFAWRGGGSTKN